MNNAPFAPVERSIGRTAPDPHRNFGEFEQHLVANSGEDAFEVAVRLLAAKISDELSDRECMSGRRFMTASTMDKCAADLNELLDEASTRWEGMIDLKGGFDIASDQLVRITRPLIGWDILSTSFHHLDALLERLVARGSKGALGQYFTPRSVIRMCVEAIQPGTGDRIIDPACGSGGFLFEALDHADPDRAHTGPLCLGIDYSDKSLKVASLLAVAAGKSHISIHKGNSVDGRAYAGKNAPKEWLPFLSDSVVKNNLWGDWSRIRGSVVLTNPPFAGDIDGKEILSAYSAQKDRDLRAKKSVSRDHLFLERAVQLLDNNGRLAIVLPQGLLANSSAKYLRTWLQKKVKILAVVGLQPDTFLPHTGVKTSVVFLVNEPPSKRDKILMLSSMDSGKDSRGRSIGAGDYSDLSRKLKQFFSSEGYSWAKQEEGTEYKEFVVSGADLAAAGRLDAEYFSPEKRQAFKAATSKAARTLFDCTERSSGRFKKKEWSEFDYIDISSIDQRTGIPVAHRTLSEDAPSRATTIVHEGDILVSTVRPERNVVGYVNNQAEVITVASSGFCVLKPKREVSSELLFAFCKSELFKNLLSRRATASMYPVVTESDVLTMPLVVPSGVQAKTIADKVRKALNELELAKKGLQEAIDDMNDFHHTSIQGITKAL